MRQLVSIELLKVRTQRAMKFVLIAAFALTMLSLASQIAGPELAPEGDALLASDLYQRGLLSADGGSTLLMIFVILGITSEYRHRTITSTFLAVPDRNRVLVAKLFCYLTITVVYWLVLAAITTVVVVTFLSIKNVPLAVPWPRINIDYLRDLAVLALHSTFAFGIGALIANQIGSVVAAFVEPVISNIVFGLRPKVGRFFPSPALESFRTTSVQTTFFGSEALSGLEGVLVFGGYTILLLLAAFLVTRRRDIT